MGYQLNAENFNQVLAYIGQDYLIYAPKEFSSGGRFSDTSCIRYGEIKNVEEIEFHKKSEYSFKEVLTPVSQTLFFFTENSVTEAEGSKKGAVVFLRSCDLHGLKRLDDMYLGNGPEDYYYKRIREKMKFVIIGCGESYENCFCVDMGTNRSDQYDLAMNVRDGSYEIDCKWEEMDRVLEKYAKSTPQVAVDYVTENPVHVTIPENLDHRIIESDMWREYDGRCVNCGRCNFVCPTCTCFSMQDLFYSENGDAGERRRVWASCMVDGYTDVAGGGSYRQKNGGRMRFKVLHKVWDYKKREGYHMCIGCGRCDDVCPEYISFSNCINKLETAMKEVTEHES